MEVFSKKGKVRIKDGAFVNRCFDDNNIYPNLPYLVEIYEDQYWKENEITKYWQNKEEHAIAAFENYYLKLTGKEYDRKFALEFLKDWKQRHKSMRQNYDYYQVCSKIWDTKSTKMYSYFSFFIF